MVWLLIIIVVMLFDDVVIAIYYWDVIIVIYYYAVTMLCYVIIWVLFAITSFISLYHYCYCPLYLLSFFYVFSSSYLSSSSYILSMNSTHYPIVSIYLMLGHVLIIIVVKPFTCGFIYFNVFPLCLFICYTLKNYLIDNFWIYFN